MMTTVQVELPGELLQVAGINAQEVSKLLALELFREDAVSLGRAAELCGVALAEFMDFVSEREVPLHYSLDDLAEDRRIIESLP